MRASRRDKDSIGPVLERLPEFEGRPIRLSFLPSLHARRGKLHSGAGQPGKPVHAASFIRDRSIVLDHALRNSRPELGRVLLHELFHFAWVRLGNPARSSYCRLLKRELSLHARGELGWSSESRKRDHRLGISSARLWRDYVCESFCDTAAWLYGNTRRHDEFTLARRHRDRRAEWFTMQFNGRAIPL